MYMLKITVIGKSGATYSKVVKDSDVNASKYLDILKKSITNEYWLTTQYNLVGTSQIESIEVEEIKSK